MLGSSGMRRKIREYVEAWLKRGYPEGIPDEADPVLESLNKAPSYRAICKAIMKNDAALLSLGYTREHCEAYMILKRVEIDARGRCEKCGNEPRIRHLKLGHQCWAATLDDHVRKAKATTVPTRLQLSLFR